MYSPQYKCPSCELPQRSEGQCDKCKSWAEYEETRVTQRKQWAANLTPGDRLKFQEDMEAFGLIQRKKPEPMTLERACQILAERAHRYELDWIPDPQGLSAVLFGYPASLSPERINKFEAIAIAEKYERESKSG